LLAFHAIISAYGFWLPNDPRGSWSTYVGSRTLHRFGGSATKIITRQSVASQPHNSKLRQASKSQLKHPVVKFTGEQARFIVNGFQQVSDEAKYTFLALSVLPTHIHAVIGNHQRKPAQVIGHLKRGATDQLINGKLHPCLIDGWITHSCWARQAWAVYIDTEAHLQRAIQYVLDNPLKDGMRRQRWKIVKRHRQDLAAVIGPTSGPANASTV